MQKDIEACFVVALFAVGLGVVAIGISSMNAMADSDLPPCRPGFVYTEITWNEDLTLYAHGCELIGRK